MRFLHAECAWWLAAVFAAVALLKWRVRWRFAAFTSILPGRRFPYRASLFRRLPFAVLAPAAALAGAALMPPGLPYFPAGGPAPGPQILLLLAPAPRRVGGKGCWPTLRGPTLCRGRARRSPG